MYEIILSFVTAFLIAYFAIPNIISVAREKKLFDEPEERRSHTVPTPSLGGIAIFAGIIVAVTLWTPQHKFGQMQYVLCSLFIMFMIGIKDDLTPIRASSKLVGQLIAASILVVGAGIHISNFHGLFGLFEIPYSISAPLSVFVIIVVINAFNLIDGINGLSGGLGILICITFGTWFYMIGRPELALFSAATVGALIAFLRYNFTPAEIFMGDTGSLIMGTIVSVLTISFLEAHVGHINDPLFFQASPAIVVGIIILPLFDTLRVFTLRIAKGKSPFSPDRNHIHHLLIDCGLSHMRATYTLLGITLLYISMVYSLRQLGSLILIGIIVGAALILTIVLSRIAKIRKEQRSNRA